MKSEGDGFAFKKSATLKGNLEQTNQRKNSINALDSSRDEFLQPVNNEVIVELRHKFIYILKSLYWQMF